MKSKLKPLDARLFAMMACCALGLACAAEPEEGMGKLSCSKTVIAPVDVKIEALYAGDETVTCASGIYPGPKTYFFRVTREEELKGPGSGDSESSAMMMQVGVHQTGVPNIGFRPFISHPPALNSCKTAEEFLSDPSAATEENQDCEVTNYDYAGVVTPSSEWCSDSTGLIKIQVWPRCGENNSTNIGIIAGAAKVDGTFSLSIQAD